MHRSSDSTATATVARPRILLLLAAVLSLSIFCLAGCGGGKSADTMDVTLTVDVSAAVEKGFSGETLLYDDTVAVPTDGTVLDALDAAGLTYKTEGGSYITSIGSVDEGAYGSMSGWTFTLNDEYPMDDVSSIALSSGDAISFVYVTEFTSF